MTCAPCGPMPGISSRRACADSTAVSAHPQSGSRAAIVRPWPVGGLCVGHGVHQLFDPGGQGGDLDIESVDLIEQHPREFAVVASNRPVRASTRAARLVFIRPRARSASRRGSRSPAISASSMSRTESVAARPRKPRTPKYLYDALKVLQRV